MTDFIITIVSAGIVIGCIIFTKINKKKHPEKYAGEENKSTASYLFGDFKTPSVFNKKNKKDKKDKKE